MKTLNYIPSAFALTRKEALLPEDSRSPLSAQVLAAFTGQTEGPAEEKEADLAEEMGAALDARTSATSAAQLAAAQTAAHGAQPYAPASSIYRPSHQRSLLRKSLQKINDDLVRHDLEILNGKIDTPQAKLLAAYTSTTACRLEFMKAFCFEAIQGFKHAPHIMRHRVKQAYKKVMDDVRRYDGFTVRLYRESVDYYDELTDHFNASLRNLLDIVRLDTYFLLKEALPHLQRRPTPDQLHLLADLFLARTLMDLTFTRAEEEVEEIHRLEGVEVGFMLSFYPVRLHKDFAALYAHTADALAGDVAAVPLLEGSAHQKLEDDLHLLLEKLVGLSFGMRMVNEVKEAHDRALAAAAQQQDE